MVSSLCRETANVAASIEAIRHTNDDLKMPPKQKLSDAQVADFVAWVNMGAPARELGKFIGPAQNPSY
jgi:hypothetical protein